MFTTMFLPIMTDRMIPNAQELSKLASSVSKESGSRE